MIELISRPNLYLNYSQAPSIGYDSSKDEDIIDVSGGVLHLNLASREEKMELHKRVMFRELQCLFHNLGLEDLLVFGASDLPWRFREKKYKEARVRRIMKSFATFGLKPRFSGAVKVPVSELWPWFRDVLYCVRVNALVQEMFFMDTTESVFFSPCQYGNVHITVLTTGAARKFKKFLLTSPLVTLDSRNCGSELYNRGPIPGRQSTYY
ncbi:MAG: hypothetical protein EOP04_22760 [Proteobacteria bacterium]|nr:MAG: hypothetical protein EOP04_22760 [Pseudomonadota bacterium]